MTFAAIRRGPAAVRASSERPANSPRPHAHRMLRDVDESAIDPLARDTNLARLETVLMMADEPLSAGRLGEVLGNRDSAEVRKLVGQLQKLYEADGSAFQVELIAGGYRLLSLRSYQPWLARLRSTGTDLRLSSTAMETLAVIAYRQPVMRAELEKVRGVACGEIIRQLMEKGLVKIVGRDTSLGRPQLYGTTKRFLMAFGLNTLKDLPAVQAARPT